MLSLSGATVVFMGLDDSKSQKFAIKAEQIAEILCIRLIKKV